MSGCKYYPPEDLDELEELAEAATGPQQEAALQIIAAHFHDAHLAYGVMGGLNFCVRGSGRATQDVDVAVSKNRSLEATLGLLSGDNRITRPKSKTAWVSGVARIFVLVGRQQVQIDLKWQRAEGHGMPEDLMAATELIEIGGRTKMPVRFFSVGPLVKAKFRSYGRDFDGDYTDLRFVCIDKRYRNAVRDIADAIPRAQRMELLEEVEERNPKSVPTVAHALKLDDTPAPEPARPAAQTDNNRQNQNSEGSGTRGNAASGRAGPRIRNPSSISFAPTTPSSSTSTPRATTNTTTATTTTRTNNTEVSGSGVRRERAPVNPPSNAPKPEGTADKPRSLTSKLRTLTFSDTPQGPSPQSPTSKNAAPKKSARRTATAATSNQQRDRPPPVPPVVNLRGGKKREED
ncbi:hypothetical protein B0J18DRAFT_433149 [Chaetomium sp. MPI-SDFR-AT-0129]|nr:hypothetical protein B0J18DRAFT_433149 [Chaetomium sp. MPI-SDFR-AT-0129]